MLPRLRPCVSVDGVWVLLLRGLCWLSWWRWRRLACCDGKPPAPAGSPWLQSRKVIATQLDHWEQVGDCADNLEATIVECAWREPTRWWPREVTLTMMRLSSAAEARSDATGATFVIIGSDAGEWRG